MTNNMTNTLCCSILEGGYTAALKHVYQSQSTAGLSTHLVDIDLHVVDALLGRDSHHIGTVVAAHPVSSHNTSQNQNLDDDGSMAADVAKAAANGQPQTAANPGSGATLSNFQKVSENFFSSLSSATNNLLFSEGPSTSGGGVEPSHTTSGSNTASNGAASSSAAGAATTANAKVLFSGFTKKLSVFGSSSLESLKKTVSAAAVTMAPPSDSVKAPLSKSNQDEFKRKEGFILVNKGATQHHE
jgi:hypothetical protein